MMTYFKTGPLPWLTSAAIILIALGLSAPLVAPFQIPIAPEDGVVLVSWWATAALAAWFAISIILWSIALRSSRPGATRFAVRFAFPGTRKLAESTLGIALLLAPAACTAATSDAPTLSLVAHGITTTEGPQVTEALPASSASTTRPSTTSPPLTTQPIDEADLDELAPTVEVQCGDNLWKIASTQLGAQLGREPSSAEIAPFWSELVLLNREALSSGDPDLIYPGEVLTLPMDR